MTRWVVDHLGPDVPMHFTAFHPDWKMQDIERTPQSTLTRAREISRANGVRYAYTGNVRDPAGSSTRCHHCDALLIERDWHRLGHWGLDREGKCQSCGTRLAGYFAEAPEQISARPVRVRFS
jgi:pyruvate formate lyase activating enzyme